MTRGHYQVDPSVLTVLQVGLREFVLLKVVGKGSFGKVRNGGGEGCAGDGRDHRRVITARSSHSRPL